MEGARTESKVSARNLQEVRRKRWHENTGWTVRNKKMREIRWNFIVCGLESERGKLNFYVPVNWQPADFVRLSLKTRWNSTGCHWRLRLDLLWPWLLTFWPRHLTIYEPKYIYDQHWAKLPSLVFVTWCSQNFQETQTHSLIHGQTDQITKCLRQSFPIVLEA